VAANGRASRRFETLALDTLAGDKSASCEQLLAALGNFADAGWKRGCLVLK
jgi:hypothetical protein